MSNTKTSTIEFFTASQLQVDPDLQRKMVGSNFEEIRRNYDPEALGQLIVSRRTNGTLVILDGQHRWQVVALEDPTRKLECKTWVGLTRPEEAEIFLRANAQAAVSALAKFKMAVEARRPAALRLQNILDKYGLKLGNASTQINAVTDLLTILTWPDSDELLDWALSVLTTAWHGEREDYISLDRRHGNRPYRGVLVQGLARVRQRYGSQVKHDKMVAALIALGQRGPEDVFSRGKTLQASLGRTAMDAAVARVLVEVYNNMKKFGPNIEGWDFSVPLTSASTVRAAATALLSAGANSNGIEDELY